MREVAYLNRGLSIQLIDNRPGREKQETFKYEGGILQAARHFISAAAELAARMELCEHHLHRAAFFFGVDVYGYAAAVVGYSGVNMV